MNPGAPKGYSLSQLQNYTPQQQQLLSSLLGGVQGGAGKGLSYLSGLAGGDQSAYDESEGLARSKFQGQLGQIGSRFAGLGAMGSSGFQNAVSGAAGDFELGLSGQRQKMRQDAIQSLLGHSESLLGQRPYENVLTANPQKQNFGSMFGSILPSLLSLF